MDQRAARTRADAADRIGGPGDVRSNRTDLIGSVGASRRDDGDVELLLTAEEFSAEDALRLGLVNRVVPHSQLLPAAKDLARQIIRHSQAATAAGITAVTRGLNMSMAEAETAPRAPRIDVTPLLTSSHGKKQSGFDIERRPSLGERLHDDPS